MDEYKFQQRRKKRGGHCVASYDTPDGKHHTIHCSCGSRDEVTKKQKRRIIRNTMKEDLNRELRNEDV